MSTSKHLQDPRFIDGVSRLKAGKITRAQLAEELGISQPTLSKRFGYAGLLDELKATKATGKSNNGHQFQASPDNAKAYDDALTFAKQHPNTPAAQIHRRFPTLNYQVLCRKMRQARSAAQNFAS